MKCGAPAPGMYGSFEKDRHAKAIAERMDGGCSGRGRRGDRSVLRLGRHADLQREGRKLELRGLGRRLQRRREQRLVRGE